jgi:hypothetical protein
MFRRSAPLPPAVNARGGHNVAAPPPARRGTGSASGRLATGRGQPPDYRGSADRRRAMNSIIYLVGLVVIVVAILSFLGLR